MKRLFYLVVVLIAVLLTLGFNMRAAHVFALFPERTGTLAGIVSGHSGLREGRVRIAPGWYAGWDAGRLCGADPCWSLGLTSRDGTALDARARLRVFGLTLRIDEVRGALRSDIALPSIGLIGTVLRIDSGDADLALRTQRLTAASAAGFVETLFLAGLDLGSGPLTVTVPTANRIEIKVRLDGGPSALDADLILDLDASEGTMDVVFRDLAGFPDDLQRRLRRLTTEEGETRRLRLRFAI